MLESFKNVKTAINLVEINEHVLETWISKSDLKKHFSSKIKTMSITQFIFELDSSNINSFLKYIEVTFNIKFN